jgi:hypothetical protein
MIVVIALLIFLAIAAVTWAVAVALYQSWVGGPDLRQQPDLFEVSTLAVALVAVTSLIPFPGGYVASLAVWGITAKLLLELPTPRAVALFAILAALSFLSRLAILGALAF